MQKSLISLVSLLALICNNNRLIAQGLPMQNNDPTFSGKVINLYQNSNYSKVIVNYNVDDGFRDSWQHLRVQIDSNGCFNFKLPDLKKPIKVFMVINNNDASEKLWESNFYAEPGDRVKMEVTLKKDVFDSVGFTGKGAEKYNLIRSLENQFSKNYFHELNYTIAIRNGVIENLSDVDLQIDQLITLLRKYQLKKKEQIDNSPLDAQMKSIIRHEFAKFEREWSWRCFLLYTKNKEFRNEIKTIYFRNSAEFFDKPDQFSIFCPIHLIGLTAITQFEQMLENNTEHSDMASVYNKIKTKYSGILRDRLISSLLLDLSIAKNITPQSTSTRDSIYNDALATIKISYIKTAIETRIDQLTKLTSQKKLINATFSDLNGNKFNLESLKGKVFLIDAWFLGCSGCAQFHESFEKEIYPNFHDNKDFAILSINFDKKKQAWLQGVASNKYSSNKYIQVGTGEAGIDHAFFKYYNITSGPFLMLVDADGTIFREYQTYNIDEMKRDISRALRKEQQPTILNGN